MRYVKVGLMALLLGLLPLSGLRAQGTPPPLLVPMGGGYADLYGGFSRLLVSRAQQGQVKVLVIAAAYSSNPLAITPGERETNLQDAERRRYELEEACKRAAPEGVTCRAVIVPIFVREDALNLPVADYFTPDVTGVFFLGGDQTVAMQVLVNTPVEAALADLYARGAVIGGTSAGCGMQSRAMLATYAENFAAANALDFGAAEVWAGEEQRGLSFGLSNAILDQHFQQRGRLGRLLNAIAQPGVPHVGIGVDAYTGIRVDEGRYLRDAFGLYTVTVLDAETYHAAEGVRYRGPRYTLSLRNVLLHLLPPGDMLYDLETRATSLGAPPPVVERDYAALRLPEGAGVLLLGGGQTELEANPVLARFAELTGGRDGKVVVIAAGYQHERPALRAADKFAAALGVPAESRFVAADATTPVELPPDVTGIVLLGMDASLVNTAALAPVGEAWRRGVPLFADGAAANVSGILYAPYGPTPLEGEEREIATQKAFLEGYTQLRSGLGLVEASIEAHVLEDVRWGRLFSLAYARPELLALGLTENTALEIGPDGTFQRGANVVFVLDLRQAKLTWGSNRAYGIANGLLDVFAPGDEVKPERADVNAHPQPQPTPQLTPAATPTLTPTPVPTPLPTPTAPPSPAPTPTPEPTRRVERFPGLLVAGLVALLGVVSGLCFWLLRRWRA